MIGMRLAKGAITWQSGRLRGSSGTISEKQRRGAHMNRTPTLPPTARPDARGRNRYLRPRRSPRPVINRRALIRPRSGQVLETRVHDISLGGIRLRCDLATAYALHFDGLAVDRRSSPRFDIRLALPLGDDLAEFSAAGRLSYMVPESRRELAVVLVFEDLDADARELLLGFVRDCVHRHASEELTAG
jgi:hypothetical protein